jgi:hypothetical protein
VCLGLRVDVQMCVLSHLHVGCGVWCELQLLAPWARQGGHEVGSYGRQVLASHVHQTSQPDTCAQRLCSLTVCA